MAETTNYTVPELPAAGLRHTRLTDLETGLEGLQHFYFILNELSKWGDAAARQQRWYQSAFYMQADMLFTSDRRNGDGQPGAALRALRDLGYRHLQAPLEAALAEPINANGRKLCDAILRIRNEAFVHHSFDLESQGAALLYVGEPEPERAVAAFEKLMAVVGEVLDVIRQEKLKLMAELVLDDAALSALAAVPGAPSRARALERERRRQQSRSAKHRDP